MLTTYFHPWIGGAERQALALAKALLAQGHAVTVATCRFAGLAPVETVEGIDVHRVIVPRHRGVRYAASYLSSLTAFLVRQRRRYDVVHVHLLFLDALAAGLLRNRLGKPILAKVGCGGAFGDVAKLRRVPGRSLFRFGLQRLDRIVATSGQVKDELAGYGFPKSRIVQIPNGVDPVLFRPPEDPKGARDALGLGGKPVALFIGRLVPQKGLVTLLEAWADVAARLPNAMLLLAGTGPQEEQLRQLASRRNLADRVRFVGERRDILSFFHAADVFVLPSLAEGMSNALLEAMACGLPCVATRIGGTLELIRDGHNGRLVEPNDPGRLAEALVQMLGDAEGSRRMGLAARRTVEEHYAMPRVVQRYVQVYQELLHGTNGAAG